MAANHIALANRNLTVHLNDPTLPNVIELPYDRYFTSDEWTPIYAWMRSDEAQGSYTEYWVEMTGLFIAFSDHRTAVACKIKFG